MTPRLSFLVGILIGAFVASAFLGWFGCIVIDDMRSDLSRLDTSIGKVTGAFDLAFDEKIPGGRKHKK